MSQPQADDVSLTLPPHKIQELAYLVRAVATGLQAYQNYSTRREQERAAREVHAAKDALRRAEGSESAASEDIPRPLTPETWQQAEQLTVAETQRTAHVVSLQEAGRSTWAVHGSVPELGRVGMETATRAQAEQVRDMILSPNTSTEQLAPLVVQQEQPQLSRRDRGQGGHERARETYADMVRSMDPSATMDRAVARNLRGLDPELNRVISEQFAEHDLDTPTEAEQQAARAGEDQQGSQTAEAAQSTESASAAGSEGQAASGSDPAAADPATDPAVGTAGAGDPAAAATGSDPGADPAAGTGAGGAGDPAAATGGEAPHRPVVRQSLPGAGTNVYAEVDLAQAMRMYPQPDPDAADQLQYRSWPDGQLLSRTERDRDLVTAIPNWDPDNAEHRRVAANLYAQAQRDGTTDMQLALEDRFPGVRTAVQGHYDEQARERQRQASQHARQAQRGQQERQQGHSGAESAAAAFAPTNTAQATGSKKGSQQQSNSGQQQRRRQTKQQRQQGGQQQ